MRKAFVAIVGSILFSWQALAAPVIVGVQSAGPGVVTLLLQTTNVELADGTGVPDVIDVNPASYQVDGQHPISISRHSVPWSEDRGDTSISPNRYGVTVRHNVFLNVGQPLRSGSTHTIASPYGSTTLSYTDTSTFCSAIQVNQVAYAGASTSRYGVFGVWYGDAGTVRLSQFPAYSVYAENSGSLLFTGTASQEIDDTATGPHGGEWTYRLPLTSIPAGGPYFISVPGCGRSRSFSVGGQAFRSVATTVFRGLYHQRCGMALDSAYTQWSRPICSQGHRVVSDVRQSWSTNTLVIPAGAPTISAIGGWHDAANFVRRPYHILVPIELLTHAEAFPGSYQDGTFGLPESGNGLSDGIDEAMWGVRLWEALQITAPGDSKIGGVRAGVDQIRDPTYGTDYAASDPYTYGTWDVDGPAGSPAEGITAYAAGIFAQASRLIRPYDATRADALLNEAMLAWGYVSRAYDLTATKTYLMYGSLQLYLATGQQSFHDLFKRQVAAIVTVPPGGGTWPEQWASSNIAASCKAVHFMSYVLPQAQPVDQTVVDAIKARVIREADSGGYFGIHPEATAYPNLASSFLDWGTTTAIRFDAAIFAWLLTTDPAKKQQYYNTVSVMADNVLGLNAMNRPFITGLGTDRINSPLHADSYFTELRGIGPVPGITIFGVTGGRSGAGYQTAVTNKLYPAWDVLPTMRHFADGWTAVNESEHSVWETVVWNAVAFAFLAGPATTAPLDGGIQDAAVDATADTGGTDATPEASVDQPSEAGADVSLEASAVDASVDAGMVDASDGTSSVSAEAGGMVRSDAMADSSTEVGDSGTIDGGRCVQIAPVCVTIGPVCW